MSIALSPASSAPADSNPSSTAQKNAGACPHASNIPRDDRCERHRRSDCSQRDAGVSRVYDKAIAMLVALVQIHAAAAAPHVPASDAQVLAELPAGARHMTVASRTSTATRLDIALPLAQFDISRARATGDLRFLGYAEAILAPWMRQTPVAPQVLVLDAT